jgi:hypothetical protein
MAIHPRSEEQGILAFSRNGSSRDLELDAHGEARIILNHKD